MQILVTGAAGFIGFHLCQKLLSQNFDVIGIDNLNNAYDPAFKKQRLELLKKSAHFIFYKADILNQSKLKSIFEKHKINVIFHLAARTGVRTSVRSPLLYRSVNAIGTEILYKLTKVYGVQQFIFASSSSVYGNSQVPFNETTNLPRPTSPYADSKQKAEKILFELHAKYQIPTTIFRFFSVYGPYGRPDMAPFIFTHAILHKKPLTLFGSNQARDYTYIEDIIKGLMLSLNKKWDWEIINLGNNVPVTTEKLITTIENQTGIKAKIVKKSKRKEELNITWAGISKAKRLLSWQPVTSFEQGIEFLIKWYKKYYL